MHESNSKDKEQPWKNHYGTEIKSHLNYLEFANIPDMVTNVSQKWGNKNAYSMVLPDGTNASLTYREVNLYSDMVAVYLTEVVKLKKGDKVALQMPNCLAYPVAAFGILKAGGIVVNTNPLYTPAEMTHQFSDSGAKVLFIIDMYTNKLTEMLQKTSIQKVISVSVVDFFPFFKKTMVHAVLKYIKKQIPNPRINVTPFKDVIKQGTLIQKRSNIIVKKYWQELTQNDLCALQYTGGTTGVSKGAMLSHGNLLANMYQIIEMGKSLIQSGEECVLTVLPLYHIFAFSINLLGFYYSGGNNILIPNPRPLSNLKIAFEKYPISWIPGVNTLFNGLLHESWFAQAPPKSLKVSVQAGSALQRTVATEWTRVTKTPIVEGFGLTETSPVVSFNPMSGLIKEDTVGIPVPDTEVILLDEAGEPVAFGTLGELAVKGPQVMLGYWNRPDETQKTFKEGWLLTGDIAVMDTDGYIKIVDRKKDMILVSGFNVYPNEVEDCIVKLEGVTEVAVIGVPHKQTGEALKAFIVKNDFNLTAEKVIEHCRKFMTSYKVPKMIEFRMELPKTAVGKILRKNLRAEEVISSKACQD